MRGEGFSSEKGTWDLKTGGWDCSRGRSPILMVSSGHPVLSQEAGAGLFAMACVRSQVTERSKTCVPCLELTVHVRDCFQVAAVREGCCRDGSRAQPGEQGCLTGTVVLSQATVPSAGPSSPRSLRTSRSLWIHGNLKSPCAVLGTATRPPVTGKPAPAHPALCALGQTHPQNRAPGPNLPCGLSDFASVVGC